MDRSRIFETSRPHFNWNFQFGFAVGIGYAPFALGTINLLSEQASPEIAEFDTQAPRSGILGNWLKRNLAITVTPYQNS
jgi:hypothetical protein